jgi:SAM-dependent methyltransferase
MRAHRSAVFALALTLVLAVAACAPVAVRAPSRAPDVPYLPTDEEIVKVMLDVAQVTKDDVLYDLGSGDGRIPITAATRFGTRGVGIDIDPARVAEAKANALRAGVADRVRFIEADIFEADFKDATVVTLYLLPEVNLRLRPKLLADLKPGTRIVSHNYDMGDWKPDKAIRVDFPFGSSHTVYFWVVPARGGTR